jgi:hypothetical protein
VSSPWQIDFRKIGEGKRGPVTKVLQEAFFENARGNGKYSEKWLDWSWSSALEPQEKEVAYAD